VSLATERPTVTCPRKGGLARAKPEAAACWDRPDRLDLPGTAEQRTEPVELGILEGRAEQQRMLNLFSKLRTFLVGQEIIESERRRAVRIPCRIKAAVEGVGAPVSVVNLSVLGMRIESNSRLRKNIVVTVEGREHPGNPLSARVVWCQSRGNQSLAGLMFVGSNEEKNRSWVKGALDKLGAGQNRVKERRAHIRVPTEGISYLSNRSGDRLCEGQLRNIGLGGALFECEVGIQSGTTVRLQLDTMGRPKLDEPGTVRSCRKDVRTQQFLVGIQFAETGTDPVRKFLKQIHR